MITLGIDVGFAALGWALFDNERLTALGTVTTEARDGESASEALMRRACEIGQAVRGVVLGSNVENVVMEAVSWPRSGSVTGKIGAAYGAVALALAWRAEWGSVTHLSPQAVRRGLGLDKGSGKDEILTAVRETAGCERLDDLLAEIRTKALRVHPADACAVVLASRALVERPL